MDIKPRNYQMGKLCGYHPTELQIKKTQRNDTNNERCERWGQFFNFGK